jgi:hypothetical protein
VRADSDALGILQTFEQCANQLAVFSGSLVAHGVGHVHNRRTHADNRADHGAQIIDFSPAGVFRRKLDFMVPLSGALDGFYSDVQRFTAGELVVEMDVAPCQKSVNARAGRSFQCLPAPVDVGRYRASKTGNRRERISAEIFFTASKSPSDPLKPGAFAAAASLQAGFIRGKNRTFIL